MFILCFCFALLFAQQGNSFPRAHLKELIQIATHPLQIVRVFLPTNPLILEAGGRFGEDTVNMHHFWPESTIHSFEPYPYSYDLLKAATQSYPQIFTYPVALFNYDGISSFSISLGNVGASSLLPAHPDFLEPTHKHNWWYEEYAIQVPCITLNSWAEQEEIDHIDFMWLDMEGAELQVLQAGTDLLKTVKAIYTEVNFQEFRREMTQYEALATFLNEQGFEPIYADTPDRSFQANVIFVQKQLLD
jgi:2-O-methyltransferase